MLNGDADAWFHAQRASLHSLLCSLRDRTSSDLLRLLVTLSIGLRARLSAAACRANAPRRRSQSGAVPASTNLAAPGLIPPRRITL